jgi:glycosyltransferase involved in cell wall biosynthesis
MKKIAVVNRYYPPSPASTGDLAHELVHQLQNVLPDYEVFVVTTDAPYKGGWREELQITERVVRSKVIYTGNNSVLRFVAGFLEGRTMAKIAFREADAVISMTNPPLVNYWMGKFARKFGKKYIEWTLDVFPVAFAKAGYIGTGSPFYNYFHRKCSEFYPDFNLFLGEGQREFVHGAFNYQNDYAILPCGIKQTPEGPEPGWKSACGSKTVLGYVGNLGEAHSPEHLIALVNAADVDRVQFIFCMYGAKADMVRTALGVRENVIWVENIPDSDLTHMDIHIVSLLPEWTHISVPSKAVSAICMGKPILLLGDAEADNWRMFSDAGWRIDVKNLSDGSIRQVLADVGNVESLREKMSAAVKITSELQQLQETTITSLANYIRLHT